MRIVSSLDELLLLPRDRCVNGFRTRTAVRLEIPDITQPALVRAQDALNQLQERGGSITGAVCMLLTLVYGVVLVVQRHESLWNLRGAGELLAALGLSFAVGLVARFASCIHTRWQFRRLCRELHRALAGQHAGPEAVTIVAS